MPRNINSSPPEDGFKRLAKESIKKAGLRSAACVAEVQAALDDPGSISPTGSFLYEKTLLAGKILAHQGGHLTRWKQIVNDSLIWYPVRCDDVSSAAVRYARENFFGYLESIVSRYKNGIKNYTDGKALFTWGDKLIVMFSPQTCPYCAAVFGPEVIDLQQKPDAIERCSSCPYAAKRGRCTANIRPGGRKKPISVSLLPPWGRLVVCSERLLLSEELLFDEKMRAVNYGYGKEPRELPIRRARKRSPVYSPRWDGGGKLQSWSGKGTWEDIY